jgi:acyl-CoA thioester hydrolase
MKEYTTRIRVRYSEIDKMDVAHNAAYLHWFEIGRTELLRQLGYPYRRLEEAGYMLPVAEAVCRYMVPARYDDELEITTEVRELKKRTVTLGCAIRRGETVLAKGHTVHVCVGIADSRITSLPDELRAALETPGCPAE